MDRDPRHEKFGQGIGALTTGGQSRWFNAEPEIAEKPVQTFEQRWMCPMDDCSGEMVFNGLTWPTGDPGYHHTCDTCGFTAAIHDRYPRNVTR